MRILVLAFVLVLGVGVVFSTGACGGSGTTPPPPAGVALLAGSYFIAYISAQDAATDHVLSNFGICTSGGAGTLTVDATENDNGAITGPNNWGTIPYTLTPDRVLKWQSGGMDAQSGGISADGRVAVGATVLTGWDPALSIMIRREGSWSTASLGGVYHLCALVYDSAAPHLEAWWGTVTFDTAGGAAVSYARNEDGTVQPPTGGASTYSVMADGTVTLAAPPTAPYQGGILLGGDLVILSGSTAGTEDPGVLILIRQSTAATLATASGTYFLSGLSRDGGGGFESITGPAMLDGAGNVSVSFTRNDDGVITSDPPQVATYTVAANGVFTVSTGGGEVFQGAVSPDGRFAMISGETTGAGNPQINFMLR